MTGAAKVLVFDHVVRSPEKQGKLLEGGAPIQNPVTVCHNDYTDISAPNRVLQLADVAKNDDGFTSNTVKDSLLSMEEAKHLLATHRVAFINVWRNINTTPVKDRPLAICDKQSFGSADFLPLKFIYPEREGGITVAKHNPDQNWFYFSEMAHDEVMLLKCYDSKGGGVPSIHSAFSLPTEMVPEGAPTRESIEMRTIAFFPLEESERSDAPGVPTPKARL